MAFWRVPETALTRLPTLATHRASSAVLSAPGHRTCKSVTVCGVRLVSADVCQSPTWQCITQRSRVFPGKCGPTCPANTSTELTRCPTRNLWTWGQAHNQLTRRVPARQSRSSFLTLVRRQRLARERIPER